MVLAGVNLIMRLLWVIDNIAQIFQKIKELENSKDNKFGKDHYDSIATVDCAWVSYSIRNIQYKLHYHFSYSCSCYMFHVLCFLTPSV